jgi:hypothetical protein
MKAIYDACEEADVPIPEEVDDYFEQDRPDVAGVRVDIMKTEAVKEWHDSSASGYIVDITKLPKDVTIIRFENSW